MDKLGAQELFSGPATENGRGLAPPVFQATAPADPRVGGRRGFPNFVARPI